MGWLLSIGVAAAAACGDFNGESSAPTDAGVAPTVEPPKDAAPSTADVFDGGVAILDADADADTKPSRAYRYVFVTTNTHRGQFGDVDGGPNSGLVSADGFCANQTLATPLANLTWHAWLSTSKVDARDRVAVNGKVPHDYRLPLEDGGVGYAVFHAGYTFIAGDVIPEHLIDRTDHGVLLTDAEVWTGCGVDGRKTPNGDTCQDWTATSDFVYGNTGKNTTSGPPSTNWQSTGDTGQRTCNTSNVHRIYCFEVDP